MPADAAAVRAAGSIPDRWPLQLSSTGKARILVDQASCDATIDGTSRHVTFMSLTAVLDSAHLPSPERLHSTSNVAGLPVDNYLISWVATDRGVVDWFRKSTGLGDVVQYDPHLTFDLSGLDLTASGAFHAFRFKAGAPTPSPYTMTAQVTDKGFPLAPVTTNYWRQTSLGSVMIETTLNAGIWGIFRDWKLTTDPASPLGRMIGGASTGQSCSPTLLVSPIPALVQKMAEEGCLASDQFPIAGSWRKEVVTSFPADECARYRRAGVDDAACEQQLAQARTATEKYVSIANAVADGYAPFTTCEADSAGAAMGYHWARLDRMVQPSLSADAPAILLYLKTATGFRLLGAEYEANATVGGLPVYGSTPPDPKGVIPAPRMFGGKRFDGPMAGHNPVQPWHYDLHVWLWQANPAGVFEQYNPTISC